MIQYCILVFGSPKPDIPDGTICFDGHDSIYVTPSLAAAVGYQMELQRMHPHCEYKVASIQIVPE